ncbi:MAG: apolipoprotein N-acyltransferase [Armatimonadaceae bacterium]
MDSLKTPTRNRQDSLDTTPPPDHPPRKRNLGAVFRALFLGAASGGLFALAFPLTGWFWLAWVALAPLFVAWRGSGFGRGGWSGFGFGLTLFLVGGTWLTAAGVVPWVILSLLIGGQFALFGLAARAILRRTPVVLHPLTFAALWVLIEWVRSLGGYAFPWFIAAASQAHNLPVLQIVSLTGQWGLSFVLALCAALVGEAVLLLRHRSRMFIRSLALAVAVWGVTFGLGWLLLQQEENRPVVRENRRTVGVVQGSVLSIPPGADYASTVLLTYLDLTREAVLETGKPLDLLLWPEGVTPDNLLLDNYSLPPAVAVARSLQTPLLIGTTHEENGLRFNTAVLLDRNGEVQGRYDKTHVVPVGEFFPLRSILNRIYLEYNVPENDFAPGSLPNVLTVGRLSGGSDPAGVMICYDVAFPDEGRKGVRRGAQFWAQLTADTPFEETNRPEQHADITSLRTVETRRWMVRAALSGISQVVDPTGREVARLPLMARRTLVHEIELRNDLTLYVRWGNWFVWLCAIFVGMGLVLPRFLTPARQKTET